MKLNSKKSKLVRVKIAYTPASLVVCVSGCLRYAYYVYRSRTTILLLVWTRLVSIDQLVSASSWLSGSLLVNHRKISGPWTSGGFLYSRTTRGFYVSVSLRCCPTTMLWPGPSYTQPADVVYVSLLSTISWMLQVPHGERRWGGRHPTGSVITPMVSERKGRERERGEREDCTAWFHSDSRCDDMTFGRPNWFDKVKDEVTACRNSAALFDLTPQAKFEIKVLNN